MASVFALQLQHESIEVHPRVRRSLDANASCRQNASALEVEATSPYALDEEDDEFPEGGLQAWLVVLGAWCAMVPTMGMINTFGVLQAWIAQHELVNRGESVIGWIFSIHAFIVYFAGAQVGAMVLMDYSPLSSIDEPF